MDNRATPRRQPLIAGRLKRRSGDFGMWRSCSCELYPSSLLIRSNNTGDVIDEVKLSPITTVKTVGDEKSKKFVIEDGDDNLYLEAPTAEGLEDWIKNIKTCTLHECKLTMDNFKIISTLGKGYYGKVMLVEHKDTKALFALKSVHKSRLLKESKVQTVFSERNILIMSNHPFIVGIKFAFQNEKKIYLGLEYVSGGELFSLIERGVGVPWKKVSFYVAEVALALDYLHSIGIVYRDLKLENVLLCEDGHIKLTDFGLSKCLGDEADDPTTSTFCGTSEYLAPEVVKNMQYGFEIDWWALGVFTYEFIFTVTPFYSKNTKTVYQNILTGQPKFPHGTNPVVIDFIKKMLTKDPAQRPTLNDIKSHPFFQGIDFDDLLMKKLDPPIKPKKKKGPPKPSKRRRDRADSDATAIATNDFDGFSFAGDLEQL